jgi:exopolysaccharide biosynthesis polyprenyl glycosylphosphotransferase
MKRSELFFMFLLLPVDVAMIFASFVVAFYLRTHLHSPMLLAWRPTLEVHFRYSLYLLPAWIVVLALNGMYDPASTRRFLGGIRGLFLSNCVIMLFLGMAGYAAGDRFFSGSMVLWTLFLSVLLMALGRMGLAGVQHYLFGFGLGRKNVLLIGSGRATGYVAQHLKANSDLGMRVVGALGEGPRAGYRVDYLGNLSRLDEAITRHLVDEIIVAEKDLPEAQMADIIRICSDRSLALDFVPAELCSVSPRVKAEMIGTMPVLKVQAIPLDGWGRIVKRMFDFVFALVALVVLTPLIVAIAGLEKLTSRGPVFYAQDRIGRDGRKFKVYKFRSMYVEQCDFVTGGCKWSTERDPRVTPFGKFLRRTNLDEMPQLWNILIGNMSLVGPRPEQPTFVRRFEQEIPEYYRRHRVKSGLTGWAQVHGLRGDTSIPERVKFDMYYIENWSLWLDARIILMTVGVVAHELLGGKVEHHARA